jgi:hypothetical protein
LSSDAGLAGTFVVVVAPGDVVVVGANVVPVGDVVVVADDVVVVGDVVLVEPSENVSAVVK